MDSSSLNSLREKWKFWSSRDICLPTWLKSVAAEAQEVMAAAARAENAVSLIQRNECMFITEKGAFFSIWGKSWRRDVSVTDLQVIVYLIKRPHDAILLSLFPEGDKSKWKPVHPEISGGGRGRKEENSWVDKSTIKFEILCGSPAFVILELHGNGFHFTDVFLHFFRFLLLRAFFGFPLLHPSRRGKSGGMTAFLFAAGRMRMGRTDVFRRDAAGKEAFQD